MTGLREEDTFGEVYRDQSSLYGSDIEEILTDYAPVRLADLQSDVEEEIAEAEREIADGLEELEEARDELAEARVELDDGQEAIADAWVALEEADIDYIVSVKYNEYWLTTFTIDMSVCTELTCG